jgi:hypothetical protein
MRDKLRTEEGKALYGRRTSGLKPPMEKSFLKELPVILSV